MCANIKSYLISYAPLVRRFFPSAVTKAHGPKNIIKNKNLNLQVFKDLFYQVFDHTVSLGTPTSPSQQGKSAVVRNDKLPSSCFLGSLRCSSPPVCVTVLNLTRSIGTANRDYAVHGVSICKPRLKTLSLTLVC